MKKLLTVLFLFIAFLSTEATAQEKYGRTLNLGVGIGYYRYVGHSMPVFNINYEFDIARNFTVAPSISVYSYSRDRKWDGNWYTYRETVIPVGAKFTYYFDELLGANDNWDFYLGGTLGFAFRSERWDSGYRGKHDYYRGAAPLYATFHVGTEYHFNQKIGMFLDLSNGVSTLGIAIHH